MIFVVQEHHARSRHWDLRLEIDGTLKSWAVPKGPSLDPAQKRLAIAVADHALAHASYQGIIPEGSYGAGPVILWDRGRCDPVDPPDPAAGLSRGRLTVRLHGRVLKGLFSLTRFHPPARADHWLLTKLRDEHARPGWETPELLAPARLHSLRVKVPVCQAG